MLLHIDTGLEQVKLGDALDL